MKIISTNQEIKWYIMSKIISLKSEIELEEVTGNDKAIIVDFESKNIYPKGYTEKLTEKINECLPIEETNQIFNTYKP